ncbi:hypothetical protein DPMN_113457 [Dreissena polymorpha]|uniref:Uncharacterized protein n=2 Tax=Dreissena polymorpha TaxID=45954 RepID=A0A9D4QQP6_DREPO|nr:hypothetical protein DPMN_113457 [Dreissena polymorpha]
MDCEGKHISRIAEICSGLGNITMEQRLTLRAGRNNFGNFNATELEGCEHLYELNVNFNQISEIRKDTFINFTNLKILDLSRNNLMVFKSGWSADFMPLSLTTLILNGCPVDKAAIRNYPNLSHLRKLQMLRIDGLRDTFDIGKRTNRLQELSLSGLYSFSHCSIPHISNWTFKKLVSIVKLNISACSVRSISAGAFEHLKHLQILDLSYNRKLGFRSMENISYGLQFTDIRSVYMSYIHTTFGLGTSLLR